MVIGLGNFGKTLAETLTDMGHEIIGIDSSEHCVDDIKNRISLAYIMDATEKSALRILPIDEIDCAVVAIGQSMDHSLRTVAALKELGIKKIFARALDPTHKSILSAMSISDIFIPESYAARVIAEKMTDKESDLTSLD